MSVMIDTERLLNEVLKTLAKYPARLEQCREVLPPVIHEMVDVMIAGHAELVANVAHLCNIVEGLKELNASKWN